MSNPDQPYRITDPGPNGVVTGDRTHSGFLTWVSNDLKVEEFATLVKDMAETLIENDVDPTSLAMALMKAAPGGGG